ncbi:MAG: hypothetical protein QM736_00095, partial [Vicinamibacterales bacterium]
LHHLLHLHELFEETIDFFDLRAAAVRDAFATAAVDDVMIPAFVRRHRSDDRFDTIQLLRIRHVVAANALEAPMPGIIPRILFERPHLLDCSQLVAEVVERELVRSDFLLQTSRRSSSCDRRSAFSMSERTSPIPSTRDTTRSAWNGSRSSGVRHCR